MAKANPKSDMLKKEDKGESPKRVSASDVPISTLEKAIVVPKGIYDEYNGKSVTPINAASAVDMSPTSSSWRDVAASAFAYGLTTGGWSAKEISITDIGRGIVAPKEDGLEAKALIQALLKPRILKEFYEKYDNGKFPKDNIALNVLVDLGVPQQRANAVLELIKANGRFAGVFKTIKENVFVQLEGAGNQNHHNEGTEDTKSSAETGEDSAKDSDDDDVQHFERTVQRENPNPSNRTPLPDKQPNKPIFIGHGKNRKPLEKLEKMLTTFGIPYKVTINEANLGRPIPDKVRQTMLGCGSAILIFSKDEIFEDKNGNEIWRPSENVVHELGASSFAFEDRIVVFKERGLMLASNYSSLGYIEFETETMEAQSMELLKELIGFGLVKVTAA